MISARAKHARATNGNSAKSSRFADALKRVTPGYMCNELAGPRLADVETVFAAVATGAKGLFAFINEIAMTVALSQFRIAFRGGGEHGKSCHHQ